MGLELRVLKDIGEDVDSRGYIGVESLGIVYGVLTLQVMLASFQAVPGDPNIQMCRRSDDHPYSRFRAPIVVVFGCSCPKSIVNARIYSI